MHGVDANKDWKAINEELKDELYFYFNSKYARREYRTERGEQFSLLVDTDEGKRSSWETVLKFMQVVDNQWISKIQKPVLLKMTTPNIYMVRFDLLEEMQKK